MIVFHSTENQHGKLHYCATVNNTVYVPYHKDEAYIIKRANQIEKELNNGTFDLKKETFDISLSKAAKQQFNIK